MQSAGLSDTAHYDCAGCRPQLVLKWIVLHSVTSLPALWFHKQAVSVTLPQSPGMRTKYRRLSLVDH